MYMLYKTKRKDRWKAGGNRRYKKKEKRERGRGVSILGSRL